jgi:putative transposase
VSFIDAHADRCTDDGQRWSVEPICRVLTEHGTPIFPSTFYNAGGRTSAREYRDDSGGPTSAGCSRRSTASTALARAGWRATGKASASPGASVEGMMRELGLERVRRGRIRRTTSADRPIRVRRARLTWRNVRTSHPEHVVLDAEAVW